jgi:phosphoglycolate phosphatase
MSGHVGRHQLILFDIDGTLINTGGAGGKAMSRAFASICRVENGFAGIPLPGRTDTMILADAFAKWGFGDDVALLDRFRSAYYDYLADELCRMPEAVRVLPGVPALLDRLAARPATTVGLLTGNYSRAAELKLSRFGIWSCFSFGAFGEDANTREGLVAVAYERARKRGMPEIPPHDVVIVGDTPLDVACGRANGARTVGVATGSSSAERLAEAGADLVLTDLGDADRFLAFLDDDGTGSVGAVN